MSISKQTTTEIVLEMREWCAQNKIKLSKLVDLLYIIGGIRGNKSFHSSIEQIINQLK